MLQSLRVRNLAIVEDARVVFGPGLNVITGETGAGKSIIVGALGLLLGERADRGAIRSGASQLTVEAEFALAEPDDVNALLEDIGLDPCEDGRLIIRRIVSASGAKNFINDGSTTLQVLKQVGDLLVDMHGPHDHQSLLRQEFQMDILDAYGHLWKQRETYEDIYASLNELRQELTAIEGDSEEMIAQQRDLYAYQVKEIEDAEIEDCDEEELVQEHTLIANASRILELADGVEAALTGDEASAFNALVSMNASLTELAGLLPEAKEWQTDAKSVTVQIQELGSAITAHVQSIESDPGRLQWLDDRMTLIQKLKRKYGGTIPEICEYLEQTRAKLLDLETREERAERVRIQVREVEAQLQDAGGSLGVARRKVGKQLGTSITGHLRDLGFANGAFDVELTPGTPHASGLDTIDFRFAPNVGEPMRPLRQIASSGEMSRVMLATKAVLATHDRIPVLVFDEIDANVGGETGIAIGEKLASVTDSHQVLCITHLPQVAVHGASHFVVAKAVKDNRTHTTITCVEGDARTEEVARMLGGKDVTSVVLDHAREMLARTSA